MHPIASIGSSGCPKTEMGFQRILKKLEAVPPTRSQHTLGWWFLLEVVLANTFETIILHDENSHYSTIMTIGISINNQPINTIPNKQPTYWRELTINPVLVPSSKLQHPSSAVADHYIPILYSPFNPINVCYWLVWGPPLPLKQFKYTE
jgi:hypothetical protein